MVGKKAADVFYSQLSKVGPSKGPKSFMGRERSASFIDSRIGNPTPIGNRFERFLMSHAKTVLQTTIIPFARLPNPLRALLLSHETRPFIIEYNHHHLWVRWKYLQGHGERVSHIDIGFWFRFDLFKMNYDTTSDVT